MLGASALVGGASIGMGQAVTVDGTRDYLYGTPRVWQTLQTEYGNNTVTGQAADGSELVAAYSYIGGGKLNLFFAGNLQTNGNKIFVFLDTQSGVGQNRLRGDNNGISALLRMGDSGGPNGFVFESGFDADHAFVFNAGDGSNVFVDYSTLPSSSGGSHTYLGSSALGAGSGTLSGGTNLMGVLSVLRNGNTLGVGSGNAGGQIPQVGTSGLELSIPLTSLGTVDQSVKVVAFVANGSGDHLSNQFLPDLSSSLATTSAISNLGEPRGKSLSATAGTQFFYVQPRSKNVLLANRITTTFAASSVALVRVRPGIASQDISDIANVAVSLPGNTPGAQISMSPTKTSSGHVGKSVDGRSIAMAGFSTAVGATTGTGASTIASVFQDLSVGFRNNTVAVDPRSSGVFDANFAYIAGASNLIFATTSNTSIATPNARVVNLFNNRVYYSTATTVAAISSLATSASAATTIVSPSSAHDFAFDDPRTLYVAAETGATTAIQRFVFNGTTWSESGSIPRTDTLNANIRGLVLTKDSLGRNVFFALTAETNPRVIQFTEGQGDAVALASSSSTYVMRGMDWTPELWATPTATNDVNSTNSATPVTGNVLTNDSGESKQNATVVGSSGPGSFSLAADGSYTYTPNGTPGTAVLTYKFDDGDQDSNTATLTVTVTQANQPPVADNGSFSTNEDTLVATPVVANDPNLDTLSYSIVDHPDHGAITGTGPNYAYTPDANYHGPDSFTFKANDGSVDSNVASVGITVLPVNDAPILDAIGNRSGDELTPITFTADGSDVDTADTLTYSLIGGPVGASINSSSGEFTWTPTEAQGPGSYTFTVKVADDGSPSLSDEEEITVTVNEVNAAPELAAIPNQTVTATQLLTFASSGTDPSDLPANSLTYSLIGAPVGASIDPGTGAFSWTPLALQVGVHNFTVRVTDDGTPNLFADQPVQVTVLANNTPPVAEDADFTTNEGTPVSTPVVATDADDDELTYSIVSPPSNGVISGTAPNWTYTPNGVFSGADSFTYKANDGNADSNVATVDITVNDTIPMAIDVKTSPAPNYYGSMVSYEGWEARAIDRWMNANGAPQLSRSTDPTAFETPSEIVWWDTTVTNFPFWLGVLNPSAPFGSELGHRPTFTTRVLGQGTRFSLAGLEFDINSNDPALDGGDVANMYGWSGWWDGTDPSDPGQQYYNPWTIGLDYGADRTRGTSDDVVYQAGEVAELFIDELIYVGLGYGFEAVTNGMVTDPAVALMETRAYLERKIAATGTQVDISITFRMRDGGHTSPLLAQRTQVLPLVSNNVAPTAFGLNTAVDENSANNPISVSPATDSNSFEVPLAYEVVSPPAHGTLSGTGPNWTYTPAPGNDTDVSFTYRVKDVTLTSNTATVNIVVNNTNTPPVANNASFSTDENTPVATTVTASDAETDPLAYSIVTAPANGVISGTGPNWTYTPNNHFAGADSFTFKANDGSDDSNVATVSITVADTIAMNVQVVGSVAPNAYGSPSFDPWAARAMTSLENTPGVDDGDRTLDPTAYDAVTTIPWYDNAATGTPFWMGVVNPMSPFHNELGHRIHFGVRFLGNGTRFSLSQLDFEWTSSDGNSLGFTDTWSAADHYSPNRKGIDYGPDRVKGTSDDIVYNQYDPDAPVPIIFGASLPVDELIYVGYGNAWDVTQEPGSTVEDQLASLRAYLETEAPITIQGTYKVRDGLGGFHGEGTGTVTLIPTNNAPTANGAAVSTPEDTNLPIMLNGNDLDGDGLDYTVVDGPDHGSFSGEAPNLVYHPAPNFNGVDSFTFKVSDGIAESGTVQVNITVVPVNDPPLLNAIGDRSGFEGSDIIIVLGGTDVDDTVFTFSATGLPTGASLVGNTFSWTPSEDQGPGSYDVTFTINDGSGGTDSETITITVDEVNVAPTIDPIADITADEMTLITFTASGHDTDLPANTLTYSLVGAPTGASIDGSTGEFTWPPTEVQGPGDFTFTVRVSDGTLSADESVTIHVDEANVAPTLDPIDPITANELALITFTAEGNDSDLPANTLTYSLVGAPAGAAIDANTGEFTWTPTEAQGPQVYTFTVRVSDGTLHGDVTVQVTVGEVNIAPVAIGQTLGTEVNTPLAITLSATDADLPANTLTYSVVGGPTNGSLSVSGENVIYTPGTNFTGTDSFTFKANDGTVDSNIETITINTSGTTITLNLTLQGFAGLGPTTRGMTMFLGGTAGGSNPAVDVSRDVIFDANGQATIVFTPMDGFLPSDDLSTYAISVKDELHSVRKLSGLTWDGSNYVANVTLVGGNLNRDNKVDVADYVVYAVRYGVPTSPDTPLSLLMNPLYRHADISGDGVVDSIDFSFISATFGQIDQALPGNYLRGRETIRQRMTVQEAIIESGSKRAAELDRNRDGWISIQEASQPLAP